MEFRKIKLKKMKFWKIISKIEIFGKLEYLKIET